MNISARMPAVFLGHGSPMNTLETNRYTEAWRALGRALGTPKAVLCISAHWFIRGVAVTAMPHPETIHDFGGFPEALFEVQYAAPGAPELASRASGALKSAGITAGVNGCRGLDHGAWVPLKCMYPDADVPVVQISLQPEMGTARHLEIGRALAPLTDDGILIIGSGHVTHNLRDWMVNPRRRDPLPYAVTFADWVHERLAAGDGGHVLRQGDAFLAELLCGFETGFGLA